MYRCCQLSANVHSKRINANMHGAMLMNSANGIVRIMHNDVFSDLLIMLKPQNPMNITKVYFISYR